MTMMIADPPKKATQLGVGLDANRRQHPNSDAWKTAIGTKPIAARLALLPESKPRWDRIGVSAAFQLSLLIFCVLIPLIYPDQLKTALNARMVELSSPVTEVPVAPPPPPPKAMKAKAPAAKPKEIEPVKLDPKKPHIFEIPKALLPDGPSARALPLPVSVPWEPTPWVFQKCVAFSDLASPAQSLSVSEPALLPSSPLAAGAAAPREPPSLATIVPPFARSAPSSIEPVKLDPKKPHIFEIPKALVPKERKLEAVAPELKDHLEAAKIETTTDQPKRPREDVKLNNIGSGSAAPATVKAPIEKVQTGGFGDPNGMPGKGDPKHATTVNRLGSLDLPGGEGYGNGTGGAKGIRGTVASSGFGNGVANPPAGGGRQGKVESSGFGSQTVADAPKKKAGPEGPIDSPVDIIDKPKPEYTAEGRNLKLEGDVVLDVVFLSNGTMKVNRVISGLGHGLDEAAVRAAERIRFKPAKREGQPVDFPARVRIEFRMAY